MNLMGAGPLEILFVLVVAFLVLGPSRMMEASRGLGKLRRQFRRVTDEWPTILEREANALDQPTASASDSDQEQPQPQEPDPGEAFRQREENDQP